MLDINNLGKWGIGFAALLGLLGQPARADAWQGDHDGRYGRYNHHEHYRSYPPYGKVVFGLPGSFVSVSVRGSRYYYCDGTYYRRHNAREYVVIAPPIGTVVRVRPPDCRTVIIRGATYYVSNDVYYLPSRQGYEVVVPPNTSVIEAAQPEVASATDESVTVNIPNAQGGFTAVVLKKSGSGFLGPQGEFYPEFPKVEQLKLMYASKEK